MSEGRIKAGAVHRAHERELSMIEATAAFERMAARTLFLLNSGALVVYLALFGSLQGHKIGTRLDYGLALGAMCTWGIGVVIATLGVVLAAGSQFYFRKMRGEQRRTAVRNEKENNGENVSENTECAKKYKRKAQCRRTISIWLYGLSIFLFLFGFGLGAFSFPAPVSG